MGSRGLRCGALPLSPNPRSVSGKFGTGSTIPRRKSAPDNLNEKVLDWAGKNGVDAVQLGRCMATKASDPDVARNIAEGHALNIKGTPTLFINGRKTSGVGG